ncbi:MAG: hypothetical protein KC776_04470 [Myxococcales bacterium]|nr:hypothetical protein [Myxococcales bacterium]
MFRRVALLLACSAVAAACGSRPNRTRDAAIATGAAVAAAGVYRATTGGCWAACPPRRYCNSATGTCDEFPQGSPPVAAAAAAPEANDWWRAGDAACPEGAALDEDEPVILCTRPDGTPHGPATFFYSNGRRESEGEYRDGKPIGVWRHWDEDGHPTKTEDLGGQ